METSTEKTPAVTSDASSTQEVSDVIIQDKMQPFAEKQNSSVDKFLRLFESLLDFEKMLLGVPPHFK